MEKRNRRKNRERKKEINKEKERKKKRERNRMENVSILTRYFSSINLPSIISLSLIFVYHPSSSFIFFLHLIFDGNLLSLSFQGYATKVSRREKKKKMRKEDFLQEDKLEEILGYIFQPILTVSEKVYHSE